MRKILTTILAAAALTAVVEPAAAQACSNWRPDTSNVIYQSNGWNMNLWYGADGYWKAQAFYPGAPSMSGKVMFSSFTASSVAFTITWTNGTAGIYEGRIDQYGFISGTSRERYSFARATWRMRDVAICAG